MKQPTLPPWAQDLGHGVYAVDTAFHRDHFDAAYLVVHGGRAAFIDTGTNHAVPRLLGLLDVLGLKPADVDHVIPTHVHLDHAGGVGALMAALPGATMWAHPRGLRHMVDPGKLYAGALAIYGQDEMDRSYGQLVPVPEQRARPTHDGMVLDLAGRRLRFIDTPGHAMHHHCIWDEITRGWFTGDTFGLSYREFDTAKGAWITPTTTPVQFDPEALAGSIERLLAARPDCLYLTHFGRVAGVPRLGTMFLDALAGLVEIARRHADAGEQRHQRLKDELRSMYLASLQAHGCRLPAGRVAELLALDIELNAQGIGVWLDRKAARTTT